MTNPYDPANQSLVLFPCTGGCGESKVEGDFPLTSSGNRSSVCHECVKVRANEQLERSKQKRMDERLRQFAAMVRGDRIDVPHVSEFLAKFIQHYGSVDKFVEAYCTHVDAAEKGSARAINAMQWIGNLVKISTDYRDSAPDLTGISDDELTKTIRQLMTNGEGSEDE